MASEDDYLHLSCESSDSEEEKTLPENASKNMAYSRISLNHILRKTALLTIVVIRKRRRWTADIAVARTVSSGEYFCFLPSSFFFPSFFFFFHSRKNILGHFKRHFVLKYHPQSLRQGHIQRMKAAFVNARDLFADISTGEVCTEIRCLKGVYAQ